MKMEHHMLVTAPIAAGTYYFTHSWLYAGMAIFLGVLVDIDHVFDYIREEGRFDVKGFFEKFSTGYSNHLYLLFHAWEYIPLAWIAAVLVHDYTFAVVFTVAYSAHMIPDQFMNNVRPSGYFLTYRIYTGFVYKKSFYPAEKYLDKNQESTPGIQPGRKGK